MSRRQTSPAVPDPEVEPTVSVPFAGRCLDMSRNTSYAAVARGDFPADVIRVGRQMRVVTASLRRVLQLDQ